MLPSRFGRAMVSPNLENMMLKARLMRAGVLLSVAFDYVRIAVQSRAVNIERR